MQAGRSRSALKGSVRAIVQHCLRFATVRIASGLKMRSAAKRGSDLEKEHLSHRKPTRNQESETTIARLQGLTPRAPLLPVAKSQAMSDPGICRCRAPSQFAAARAFPSAFLGAQRIFPRLPAARLSLHAPLSSGLTTAIKSYRRIKMYIIGLTPIPTPNSRNASGSGVWSLDIGLSN